MTDKGEESEKAKIPMLKDSPKGTHPEKVPPVTKKVIRQKSAPKRDY